MSPDGNLLVSTGCGAELYAGTLLECTCWFRRVGAPSVFADLDVLWCVWGLSEHMSVHVCALSDGFGWFIVVSGSSVSSVAVLYCSRFVLSVPGHLWPVHSALSGTDDASSQRSSQQATFFRLCDVAAFQGLQSLEHVEGFTLGFEPNVQMT